MVGEVEAPKAFEIGSVDGVTSNTAASLSLTGNGNITDSATASLTVTGTADIAGTSITLGDTGTDTVNFGSLTATSDANTAITENSASEFIGTSVIGGDLNRASRTQGALDFIKNTYGPVDHADRPQPGGSGNHQ